EQAGGIQGAPRRRAVALQRRRAAAHLLEELRGGLPQPRSHAGEGLPGRLPRRAPALRPGPPALAAADILQETRDRSVRYGEPELGDDRSLDAVRLVQDDDGVRWQDAPARLEIEAEQGVVDDEEIGLARPRQVPPVQAALPERPA